VLPDAEVKIFLTAMPEERARRRWNELQSRGEEMPFEEVLSQIRDRDARDSGREVDPLRPADGATVIDCTLLTQEAQVGAILAAVTRSSRKAPGGAAEETGPELR
jgi:cytidylate kinase